MLLAVLQEFARQAQGGAAIVTSLHDVNLAARYAHRCLLLFGDGRWELGPTATVLNEERLSELYDTSMEAIPWRGKQLFVASSAS